MKNLIFVGLLICWIIQPSTAQDEKPFKKGHIITGGSFSLDLKKKDSFLTGSSPLPDVTYHTNINAIDANLMLGYFILNNLAVGLKNELIFSKERTTGGLTSIAEATTTVRTVSVGPFLRYYTKPRIFFESSAGIGFLKTSTGSGDIKWRDYYWSAGFGYSIYINKVIAIEPMVNYQFLHTKLSVLEEDEKTRGLNFLIGFQIYL
jgi:hypothetical protein